MRSKQSAEQDRASIAGNQQSEACAVNPIRGRLRQCGDYAAQQQLLAPPPLAGAVQLKGSGPSSNDSVPQATSATQLAASGFAGRQQSLPFQADMERGFGQSLGHVKAYTGGAAQAANAAFGSKGYALADQIAFADPAPSKEVVAHEVAHTIQQTGASGPQAKSGGSYDAFEVEADDAAATIMGGGVANVAMRNPSGIQFLERASQPKVDHTARKPNAQNGAPATIYAVGSTDTGNLTNTMRSDAGIDSATYELTLSISAIEALDGTSFDDEAFKTATKFKKIDDVDSGMDVFQDKVEKGTTGLQLIRAGDREKTVSITASNNGMFALMRMMRAAKSSMDALGDGANIKLLGLVQLGGKPEDPESRIQDSVMFTEATNLRSIVVRSIVEATAASHAACGQGASIPNRYANPWAALGMLDSRSTADRALLNQPASNWKNFSSISSTLETRLGMTWMAPNTFIPMPLTGLQALFASALGGAPIGVAPGVTRIQAFLDQLETAVLSSLNFAKVPKALQGMVRKKQRALVRSAFASRDAAWFAGVWKLKHKDAGHRKLEENYKEKKVNTKKGEIVD